MDHKLSQVVVKAILNNSNNEILFTITKLTDAQSLIQIPNGHVQYGEPAEVSVKRMVNENTLHDIEPIAILGIYSEHDSKKNHFITIVFICIVTNFQAEKSNRVLGNVWIPPGRLDNMNINKYDNRILRDYQDWRVHKSTYWTSKHI